MNIDSFPIIEGTVTKHKKRTVNTLIRLILLNVILLNTYSLMPFCLKINMVRSMLIVILVTA